MPPANRLLPLLVAAALAVIALPVSRAGAQALNIDFGLPEFPSPPQSTFGGAAGQAGLWTIVDHYAFGEVLTTTTGEVSAVALSVGASGTPGTRSSNSGNTGDYAALLNDGIYARTTSCESFAPTLFISVAGLSNGTYDVYTYAARPYGTLAMNTSVGVTGSEVTAQITGLPPVNSFVEGRTHTLHHVTVTQGVMSIIVQDATGDAYVAGIQIVPIQIGDCSVTQQPADQAVLLNQTATFTAAITGDVREYRWIRNGVDVADGRGISGATTNTLTLAWANPGDNGTYSLRYTCGGFIRMTTGATLTVTVPPTADFNHSGGISVQDIFDFLAAYFAGV